MVTNLMNYSVLLSCAPTVEYVDSLTVLCALKVYMYPLNELKD